MYRSVQTDYASVWCKNSGFAYKIQDSPGCIASNHDLVISFTQGMLQAFQRGATWPSLEHSGQNETTR